MERLDLARGAGILLSVSSLPSPYGIGTLGKAALRFIDLLVDLKQSYWQVLPFGPTSCGNSPYQPLSSCAGNPYWIDLDELVDEGLLTIEEIRSYRWGSNQSEIDYTVLCECRYKILQKAFTRFDISAQEFQDFRKENEDWLGDFALFMSLKVDNLNKKWQEWPEDFKNRQPVALANYRKMRYNTISFWEFCQFKFYQQWNVVKDYANSRGIYIIGDIPFFVGLDSVDTWVDRHLFLLDANGKPDCVAAAVPDKFFQEGQVWGNPLFDWKAMEDEEFAWWRRRTRKSAEVFDMLRIDFFVGMVKNYVVPYGAKNAVGGKWMKGPGRKLVHVIAEELGDIPVIADDYTGAALLPGVKKLLTKSGWIGTKILMFAFDGNTANEYLPHNYTDHYTAVYVGIRDKETIVSSFRDKSEYELAYLYEYLNIGGKEEIPDALIRAAYASTADLVIIQMQDILKLGSELGMNESSVIGNNWRWRMGAEQLDLSRREWIRNLAVIYRR